MNSKMSQVKVPVSPVIVKKGSVLKNDATNRLLLRCFKISPTYKEEIICNKAKPVDCPDLEREFPDLSIINRLNTIKGSRTTTAKYNSNGSVIERTSAEIIKVIGQENYDTVLSALSSITNQGTVIRAILALLTVEKTEEKPIDKANAICQTEETSRKLFMNMKLKQGMKRTKKKPYVVHYSNDRPLKRLVVDPKTFLKLNSESEKEKSKTINWEQCNENPITKTKTEDQEAPFPELKEVINEDSNFSDITIGNISLASQHYDNITEVLENPFRLIEEHTKQITEVPNCVPLHLTDGSTIMVCAKPIDKFHWATPEILRNLPQDQRIKLMYQQAYIDWQCCMEIDEDGYFPIHHAVMSNDLEFLKRQCTVLKKKHGTVDLVSASGNMTALQMSINKDGEACTSVLLKYGADPLQQDDEGKSFFHTASEVSHDHLRIALEHCRENARQILKEDADLWKPDMDKSSDEELSKFLLDTVCLMVDNAGYTPLMLASKQGNFRTTKLLVEASPDTINRPMPNSGSTALYLAVAAAYMEVFESTNHTKLPEHYMKTIEILVANGADPSIENHAGSNVNMLLAEFNMVDLLVLIANNLTSVKYFDDKVFDKNNIHSYMLLKNSDGEVNLTKITQKEENNDKQNKVPSPSNENLNTFSKQTNNKSEKVPPNPSLNTGNKSINSDKLNTSGESISTNNIYNQPSTVDNIIIKSNKRILIANKKNLINKSVNKANTTNGSNKTPSKRTVTNTDEVTKHVANQSNAIKTQADVPKFIKILPKPDPRLTEIGKHKVNEDVYPELIKKPKKTPVVLKRLITHVTPEPSNVKPGRSNVTPEPSIVKPGPSNVKPEPSIVKPVSSNRKPGFSNVKPGFSNVKPELSNVNLRPSNVIPDPSNVIPEPSNVKPGPSNIKTVHDSNVPNNTETTKRNRFATPKIPNILLKVQKGALKQTETAKDKSNLIENTPAKEKCAEDNRNLSTIEQRQQILRQLLNKKRNESQESNCD